MFCLFSFWFYLQSVEGKVKGHISRCKTRTDPASWPFTCWTTSTGGRKAQAVETGEVRKQFFLVSNENIFDILSLLVIKGLRINFPSNLFQTFLFPSSIREQLENDIAIYHTLKARRSLKNRTPQLVSPTKSDPGSLHTAQSPGSMERLTYKLDFNRCSCCLSMDGCCCQAFLSLFWWCWYFGGYCRSISY